MSQNKDTRYEHLYTEMVTYALTLHEKNKKRIKAGTISLLVLPVVLAVIRWLTDSDKLVFLLIWVLCMFMIAAYLIGVAYLDESIQKKLQELTGTEEDFDGLIDEREAFAERFGGTVSALRQKRRNDLAHAGILPAEPEGELPVTEQTEADLSEDVTEEGGRS